MWLYCVFIDIGIVIFFDVTLALACFFGIGAVMQRYEWLQMMILLAGSVIVIFIGIGLLRAKVEEIDSSKAALSVLKGINVICGIIILFYGGKLLFNFVLMMLR